MRGRSRKAPNPLTRSYESNGPDVKIRGTALHIAEKYIQLARDAQSSSDTVAAENYFQHAEHYYRIIAAAQAASPTPISGFMRDDELSDEEDYYEPSNARQDYGNGNRSSGSYYGDGNGHGRPPQDHRQNGESNQRYDRGGQSERNGAERGDRNGNVDRGGGNDRNGNYERGYDRGGNTERGERGGGDRNGSYNGGRGPAAPRPQPQPIEIAANAPGLGPQPDIAPPQPVPAPAAVAAPTPAPVATPVAPPPQAVTTEPAVEPEVTASEAGEAVAIADDSAPRRRRSRGSRGRGRRTTEGEETPASEAGAESVEG